MLKATYTITSQGVTTGHTGPAPIHSSRNKNTAWSRLFTKGCHLTFGICSGECNFIVKYGLYTLSKKDPHITAANPQIPQ